MNGSTGVGAADSRLALLVRTGDGRSNNARDAVDHLLLGAADLEAGIAWFEARTGVKAAIGGVHPGAGTRNALASLGDRQYLEIIAPDPAQSAFNFQIDLRRLASPRLVTWAAAALTSMRRRRRHDKAGYKVFGPATVRALAPTVSRCDGEPSASWRGSPRPMSIRRRFSSSGRRTRRIHLPIRRRVAV